MNKLQQLCKAIRKGDQKRFNEYVDKVKDRGRKLWDIERLSPYCVCVKAQRYEMIGELASHGYDVNCLTTLDSNTEERKLTPLQYAAAVDSQSVGQNYVAVKIVEVLLKNGADPLFNDESYEEYEILYLALELNGNIDLFRVLTSYFPPEKIERSRKRYRKYDRHLNSVCLEGNVPIIKEFIWYAKYFNVDLGIKRWIHPINIFSSSVRCPSVLTILIFEGGVDINARISPFFYADSMTCLHYIILQTPMNKKEEMVKLALDLGANMKLQGTLYEYEGNVRLNGNALEWAESLSDYRSLDVMKTYQEEIDETLSLKVLSVKAFRIHMRWIGKSSEGISEAVDVLGDFPKCLKPLLKVWQ